MTTCCPLSSTWPIAGSIHDRARPPQEARASSSRTRAPDSARAAAAANPATPPPITTTSGRTGRAREPVRQHRPREGPRPPGSPHTDLPVEDTVPGALHPPEQRPIDLGHDLSREDGPP